MLVSNDADDYLRTICVDLKLELHTRLYLSRPSSLMKLASTLRVISHPWVIILRLNITSECERTTIWATRYERRVVESSKWKHMRIMVVSACVIWNKICHQGDKTTFPVTFLLQIPTPESQLWCLPQLWLVVVITCDLLVSRNRAYHLSSAHAHFLELW